MGRIVNREVGTAVGLIALSGLAWLYTGEITQRAAMFPRLAIALLAGLSAIYLIRELVRGPLNGGATALFDHRIRFAIALALIVGYAVIFPRVGFFTTTFVFIPVFVAAMGMRRHRMAIFASLAFVATAYILFVVLLSRRLPDELIVELLRSL